VIRSGPHRPVKRSKNEHIRLATVNPSTGEQIETFSYFTPAQTEEVIGRADKSFQSFRKLSEVSRGTV
jgi:acyl-CoA reductase-like NAD-dependent aldehyde dehydrogenase